MKQLFCVASLAVLLALVACSDSGSDAEPGVVAESAAASATAIGPMAAETPTPAPVATAAASRAVGPAEHDGQRAMAHLKALAEGIGPRVAGSGGERKAADYIRDQLVSSGYDVEVMDFTFQGDRFHPATVKVDGQEVDAFTMSGSGAQGASGAAVYVGLADDQGIAGKNLDGKIAVADRGTLRFGQKYENVRAKGAAGLVIINNQPGAFGGAVGQDAEIPVVAVAKEDGERFVTAANAGKTIAISPPGSDEGKAVNVIARAKKGGDCLVIVGGHHDSVVGAPGANDNASGTANVIELARAFAADGLDDGLCFVTFGAEESGLFGSKALAERLAREGKLPRFMVNLDVTAIGRDVEVIGSPALKEETLAIAQRLGIPASPSELPANTGSDHQSFLNQGVEVVYFTSGDFGAIHTPNDVVAAIIDSTELDRVGDVAYATINALMAKVARGQGRS